MCGTESCTMINGRDKEDKNKNWKSSNIYWQKHAVELCWAKFYLQKLWIDGLKRLLETHETVIAPWYSNILFSNYDNKQQQLTKPLSQCGMDLWQQIRPIFQYALFYTVIQLYIQDLLQKHPIAKTIFTQK